MSVEINVWYEGDLKCSAVHGPSGVKLITDAPLDNEGKASSFSPTDLAATALGTCIMTIMGMVAKRENVDLKGTKIKVTKEMASAPLRRIGRIKIQIEYPKELILSNELMAKFERVVNSCPVKQSLHQEVIVETKFKN